MSYPVALEIDYVARRSRLTTFFRFLLAIPLVIVQYVYGIALFLALIAAWFVLLFTARWPAGLHEFVGGMLRFTMRANAYMMLAVDKYPPFGLKPDASYPARVRIDPPKDKYSRIKVFLRGLYVIPAYIIAYVLSIFAGLVALISWFAIVITGKQPEGLQKPLFFCLSYMTGVYGMVYLLTETYPPFES